MAPCSYAYVYDTRKTSEVKNLTASRDHRNLTASRDHRISSGYTVTLVAMKIALVFAAYFVFATAHPLVKGPDSACEVDTSCGKRCTVVQLV